MGVALAGGAGLGLGGGLKGLAVGLRGEGAVVLGRFLIIFCIVELRRGGVERRGVHIWVGYYCYYKLP